MANLLLSNLIIFLFSYLKIMIKAINKYGYFSPKLSLEKIRIWPHCFLWMVVSISLIDAVQSNPTCDSFPKIFGGSSHNT
jgi:hypothetical protein